MRPRLACLPPWSATSSSGPQTCEPTGPLRAKLRKSGKEGDLPNCPPVYTGSSLRCFRQGFLSANDLRVGCGSRESQLQHQSLHVSVLTWLGHYVAFLSIQHIEDVLILWCLAIQRAYQISRCIRPVLAIAAFLSSMPICIRPRCRHAPHRLTTCLAHCRPSQGPSEPRKSGGTVSAGSRFIPLIHGADTP